MVGLSELSTIAAQAFAQAKEALGGAIAVFEDLRRFEQEALLAARDKITQSRAALFRDQMQLFEQAGTTLDASLDEVVAATQEQAHRFQTLRIPDYMAAIDEIVRTGDVVPSVEVQMYLTARLDEMRWIMPTFQWHIARTINAMCGFAADHVAVHAALLNVPIPGRLANLGVWTMQELARDWRAVVKPIQLPPLVSRLLVMTERIQAPHLSFSRGASDEMNRIYTYIADAKRLTDAETAALETGREAAVIQEQLADQLKTLAQEFYYAFMSAEQAGDPDPA